MPPNARLPTLMPRTNRPGPPRKTIKARGALPAPPRVAPNRVFVPWYARRSVQLLLGLVALLAVGLIVKAVKGSIDRKDQRESDLRSVRQFQRAFQNLQQTSGVATAEQELNQVPVLFQTGTVTPADYSKSIEGWLKAYRDLETGLRARKVPSRLPNVEEARAILVDGTHVYLDSIKSFQLSASLTDPALRDKAIQQGYNLLSHAKSVFGKGQRMLQREERRLGAESDVGGSPNPLLQPPTLDVEEAPIPPLPAPEGAGGIPGPGGGGIPPGLVPQPAG